MSQRSNSPTTTHPKLLQLETHSNTDEKKSSFSSINSRTNRRRTGSGSKSPPPLEPKLNNSSKKQFIFIPQSKPQHKSQSKPIIKKETVEAKTLNLPSVPSVPCVPSVSSTQPIIKQVHRHYNLQTSLEKPTKCTLCNIYIMRPYVLTSCCNKPYHPDCLSMLYTETLSFDVKNGTTFSQIYLNHECGFSNRDEEGRNYNGLTKLFKYFELGIKNCINV